MRKEKLETPNRASPGTVKALESKEEIFEMEKELSLLKTLLMLSDKSSRGADLKIGSIDGRQRAVVTSRIDGGSIFMTEDPQEIAYLKDPITSYGKLRAEIQNKMDMGSDKIDKMLEGLDETDL